MSTENAIAFRENLMGITMPPIEPEQPRITNAFQQAVSGPSQKISPTPDVDEAMEKTRLMNTVMSPNALLNTDVPKGMTLPKSDVAALGASVGGTALEAGIALFGALGSKAEEPQLDGLNPRSIQNNNFAPRPPSSSFGGMF